MSIPETIYYQDENITVTNTRAIFGTKTFAMANIASVSMVEIPPNRGPAIAAALGGLLFACICMALDGRWLSLIVLVLGIAIAIAIAVSVKPTYAVRIASTSGESNVLTSKDREYIQKIVNAVNEAIIRRG
ncbi:MAG: hypothetical protein KatS3mg054_1371 [Chloroflexus sp.]|nr:MAG: hypothetical protein KatS3mg054_1371 [Chloroflexus sp.]